MDIATLTGSSLGQLRKTAAELGIPRHMELPRRRLLYGIVQQHRSRNDAVRVLGILDENGSRGPGFLRSSEWRYVQNPEDIVVGRQLIKRHGLKRGDRILGQVRPPRRGEPFLALERLEMVNGADPESLGQRRPFRSRRAAYPKQRLMLEVPGGDIAMRTVDLIAPVGLGQRGLIVSPPKAGKTTILREMGKAIARNHPEAALFLLLVDERPEEVTEMIEEVDGEVVASTFDEPPRRHRQVAEIVLAAAKRQVEQGRDVIILMDSITRLARAYNATSRKMGRTLSGGLGAGALEYPKKFFGSARNLIGPGSLTIIATALIETGSRMDEVIFEEFKGTGNMELVLSREVASERIFPAIDLNRSGTRREELLLTDKELNRMYVLRNFLSGRSAAEAMEFLIDRLGRYPTNAEFIEAMARGE